MNEHLKILDTTRPERQRRQREVVEYIEPDDDFAPVPTKRPNPAKPRGDKRQREVSDEDGFGGSSSSSSSSSSSESSSSSSSSSEQVDCPSGDEVPVVAAEPKPVQAAPPAPRKRNTRRIVQSRRVGSREPFGLCWLTPRETDG